MAGISAVGGAPVPQVQATNQTAKTQGTSASSPAANQGAQGDTLTISAAAISIMEDASGTVQDPKHRHHHKGVDAVLLTYPNYQIGGNHPGAASVLEGGASQHGGSAPVAAVGSAGASAGSAGGAGGAGGGGGGGGGK
jgi:hypothetical protein